MKAPVLPAQLIANGFDGLDSNPFPVPTIWDYLAAIGSVLLITWLAYQVMSFLGRFGPADHTEDCPRARSVPCRCATRSVGRVPRPGGAPVPPSPPKVGVNAR